MPEIFFAAQFVLILTVTDFSLNLHSIVLFVILSILTYRLAFTFVHTDPATCQYVHTC